MLDSCDTIQIVDSSLVSFSNVIVAVKRTDFYFVLMFINVAREVFSAWQKVSQAVLWVWQFPRRLILRLAVTVQGRLTSGGWNPHSYFKCFQKLLLH